MKSSEYIELNQITFSVKNELLFLFLYYLILSYYIIIKCFLFFFCFLLYFFIIQLSYFVEISFHSKNYFKINKLLPRHLLKCHSFIHLVVSIFYFYFIIFYIYIPYIILIKLNLFPNIQIFYIYCKKREKLK
jgi:hypothetical protein